MESGIEVSETREVALTNPPFSDDFGRMARDESARLASRVVELRTRGERWLARAHGLLAEAERLEHRLRELDELLGRAPQLRLDLQTRQLQGQRLREEAARILLERHGLNTPIHYRDWFNLLAEQGLNIVGKDPLATFLTQITRSPVVSRVGKRQGVYELDPRGAYQRARARVRTAAARFAAAEAASELSEAETELEDARRALGSVLEARTVLSDSRRRPDQLVSRSPAPASSDM